MKSKVIINSETLTSLPKSIFLIWGDFTHRSHLSISGDFLIVITELKVWAFGRLGGEIMGTTWI